MNQKQYFIVIRLKGKTKIREVKKKKSASWCTNKLLNLEKVTLSAFRDVNVFILLKNYHLALKTTAKKNENEKIIFQNNRFIVFRIHFVNDFKGQLFVNDR